MSILCTTGFQETASPTQPLMLFAEPPLADLLMQTAGIPNPLLPAQFVLLCLIFLKSDMSVLMLYRGMTLTTHAVTAITCSNRHLSL